MLGPISKLTHVFTLFVNEILKTSSTFCYSVPFLKEYFLWKQKKKQKKKRKISYKVHEHTLVVYLAPRKKEPCHLIAILECSQAIDE